MLRTMRWKSKSHTPWAIAGQVGRGVLDIRGGNFRGRTEVRSLEREYIRKVPADKGFFQNSVTLDM
jgi:hypothetical protein